MSCVESHRETKGQQILAVNWTPEPTRKEMRGGAKFTKVSGYIDMAGKHPPHCRGFGCCSLVFVSVGPAHDIIAGQEVSSWLLLVRCGAVRLAFMR